jgi:hypothetical protein
MKYTLYKFASKQLVHWRITGECRSREAEIPIRRVRSPNHLTFKQTKLY